MGEEALTWLNAFICAPHGPIWAGAAASWAGALSCTTVRGPMTESTARWAMALPVPMAAPADRTGERGATRRGVRYSAAWRAPGL